jgi:D-arginine dehydrogenase
MDTADVVVIGAGIAGASVAWRLAGDRRVVLLEAEDQPGYHSTGRSAALFTGTYGHEIIRALTVASRDFLLRPPDAFGDEPLLSPRGGLWIARADQLAALEAFVAESVLLDPTVAACSVDEAVRLCPALSADYLAGAAVEPQAADIDVHSLHQGYLRGFRRLGGLVVVAARVSGLSRKGGAWAVATPAGSWSAPLIVNAAGAWADDVAAMAGARPVGLVPKRRTVITFDPPTGVDVRAWPFVLDVEEAFYFKPDAGRLLGSPADQTPTAPCDAQPEEMDIAIAVDRIETATTLQIRRIASRWAGSAHIRG